MKTIRFVLVALVVIVVAAGAAFLVLGRAPEIARVDPVAPESLDPELVEKGEMLVGLGNCRECHTSAGGADFAGGRALPTPFGVIHSTNITPDPETGIGAWSEAAFVRAMREGISRDGRHLYPAFPYDYYARTSDEDLRAIHAYLMSLEPVSSAAEPNGLGFPFNIRELMAGWNMLFHDPAPFRPDPGKDEEWNRGAYLVESLGHCGACHSERNAFGAAAKTGPGAYAGGFAEGWRVPPLDGTSPAPVPWTVDSLANYLIDGWDRDHGVAAGPMRPIADDLYEQPEEDAVAIAVYVMELMGGELAGDEFKARREAARAAAEARDWGSPDEPPLPTDPTLARGAEVFRAACSECHKTGAKSVPLALTTVVNAAGAENFVEIVLHGIQPPPAGAPDRAMPGRALQITDEDMEALAAFVRDRFADKPAWPDVLELSRTRRSESRS